MKVSVNNTKCKEVSKIVGKLIFKPSFYLRKYLNFKGDHETKARVFLYSLAICHQTHNLYSYQLKKAGWDYLDYIYTSFGTTNSKYLNSDYLSSQSIKSLADQLGTIFSDNGKAINSSLDLREERADMLIDIAIILKNNYKGQVLNLLAKANGRLVNKGKGLYDLLAKMKAYSEDPVKKKASGFIKFLFDANILKVKDWKHYFPMMDYHMQRVLLRMGCVEIHDKEIRRKLVNKESMNSDREIRNACVEATKLISNLSGVHITKMNDIFYPLGRSICTNTTLCRDHVVDKARMNFDQVIDLPNYSCCPFESVCKASSNNRYLSYWQPIVQTSNY